MYEFSQDMSGYSDMLLAPRRTGVTEVHASIAGDPNEEVVARPKISVRAMVARLNPTDRFQQRVIRRGVAYGEPPGKSLRG